MSSFYRAHSYIDVVIPCHEKDVRTLELVIDAIRKNVDAVRRIIVVSSRPLCDKAEWFDEARYPFTKSDVALAVFNGKKKPTTLYCKKKGNRITWVYQQLLKLYTPFVIPEISSDVLVVDADTIFFKKVTFIDDQGCALFNIADQFHQPYFDHMARLLPGLGRAYKEYSGICHHMLLQRPILEDLFKAIQLRHKVDPWKALCGCINKKNIWIGIPDWAGISEYEIYFNFAMSGSYKVKIRPLKFLDTGFGWHKISQARNEEYDYISCHSYLINEAESAVSRKALDKVIGQKKLSAQEIFDRIYATNYWSGDESISGGGSNLATTVALRTELPKILSMLHVKSLLDAPCGDFNWMKSLELDVEEYIGVDIVQALIQENARKYGDGQKTFICRNLITDSLPQVDFILCKDCLAHLSFEDALAVIRNFKASGSKYLFVTTNLGPRDNQNIKTGQTSPYNLELSPFNFPKPLLVVEETSAEPHSRQYRKSMGLWELKDIPVI
ncbi:MAG: DUF6492 family protein [Candidatus Babeliales bacterium]|nr:DUF6492 family protein [Candidatus Babeliales bacterium]